MNPFYIVLIIIVVVGLWLWLTYNRFIVLRNRAKEAWSDIDVQLRRRYDLIPNLVETVKGYAAHEKSVFENVTKARANAISAEQSGDPQKVAEAEKFLSGTLKTLFAVVENYPDLKASANFMELQRELRDTEDKIQAARRFYNGNVRDLNIKIESFPANIVANLFKFVKMNFFEIEEAAAREPVKVSF
ncbi:MAG TPA: LemA family protein [Candidatus Humimicrobiaceae bacterium]|nr:LemA family protein [Candidatus Humimicrobiaceae bacterium]